MMQRTFRNLFPSTPACDSPTNPEEHQLLQAELVRLRADVEHLDQRLTATELALNARSQDEIRHHAKHA